MSKKRKNTRTARHGSTTTDAAAPDPAQEQAQATPARTGTETKLWDALATDPGATTTQLADRAGIGVSTAGKALARWLSDGHVARAPGSIADDGSGKRRAAGTWTIAEPATEPAETMEPDHVAADTVTATAEQSTANAPSKEGPRTNGNTSNTDAPGGGKPAHNANGAAKLRSGELRGQVEDHLRDHPATEFSPVEIANKLARSSGAVTNALERLTTAGIATRSSDKPKRYRLSTDASND